MKIRNVIRIDLYMTIIQDKSKRIPQAPSRQKKANVCRVQFNCGNEFVINPPLPRDYYYTYKTLWERSVPFRYKRWRFPAL